MSTFPLERALKVEDIWMLWNLIFNSAVHHMDEADREKGVARYTSTVRRTGVMQDARK